ncbi:uncharacterized protein LOC117592832 [Esox lucius]|nr:uncharacterized protein LOC117592832 [Esox lucius]XP_034142840.1 uncharacterized protein LOC117592832 [Esox lucius]
MDASSDKIQRYENLKKDFEKGLLSKRGFDSKVIALLEEKDQAEELTRDDVIKFLFEKGYTQKEMAGILHITDRQIRKHLQRLELRRRRDDRPFEAILAAVQKELKNWPETKGIRAMHRRVRDGVGVRPCYREDVHAIMRVLDASGLEKRRPGRCHIPRRQYNAKGPNYVWHIDGNDKLRFYGIWLHLCIDGYSRRVIWLHAGTSNRKPEFVGKYFLDATIKEHGCPNLVRSDRGTENSVVAVIQIAFRSRATDSLSGDKSFRYGKSVHNQRAEAFNSVLKRSWIFHWQSYFESMQVTDLLDISNPIHIHLVQYCYLTLVEKQLQTEQNEWNDHMIRKQVGAAGPFGKPNIM